MSLHTKCVYIFIIYPDLSSFKFSARGRVNLYSENVKETISTSVIRFIDFLNITRFPSKKEALLRKPLN